MLLITLGVRKSLSNSGILICSSDTRVYLQVVNYGNCLRAF